MSNAWANPGAVISSPFLAGTMRFQVERRQQIVGQNGRVTTTTTWLVLQGIVTPGGGNAVTREDALQIQGKTISVVTRLPLYGVVQDGVPQVYQPDRIHWRGDVFQVVDLTDAMGYGPGYTSATCASIDLVDRAPART